jgi:hypothetical protein
MRAFHVTIKTLDQRFSYTALGISSGAVHAAALDRFGGLCGVTVIPCQE